MQSFRKLRYMSSETSVQFIVQLSLSIWLFKWGPIFSKEYTEGGIERKIRLASIDPIIYYYVKLIINILGLLSSAYGTINQTLHNEILHIRKNTNRTNDFYKSNAKPVKK